MRALTLAMLAACGSSSEESAGVTTTPTTEASPPTAATDLPWLVPSPTYEPDTDAELQEWLDAYGGEAALGEHTVAAVTAYLAAEDALRAGAVDTAGEVLDAVWSQWPIGDAVWWGTGLSGHGEHVGYPAAYYGLRMLTDVVAQGDTVAPDVEPIRLTLVLVGCAEGVQPTTWEELESGTGPTVTLTLSDDLLAEASAWTNQATWGLTRWAPAITGGRLPLQVSVAHLPDVCLPFSVDLNERVFAGPTDYSPVWDALPPDLASASNWYWVLHPSTVPTTPDFEGVEVVTGGMGWHPTGAPLFLSDDLWLVRKPPHLGDGPWFTIERRIYLNQWLQHELMHHIFAVYPEYRLEETSHQWFDRSTWPSDFEGIFEPDYYAEAIWKRLQEASPPLASLRYGVVPPGHFADLDESALLGTYMREPVENEWHVGTIALGEEGQLRWTNDAGVSWGLTPDLEEGLLITGPECPYDSDFRLEASKDPMSGLFSDTLAGFRFNGELYALQ